MCVCGGRGEVLGLLGCGTQERPGNQMGMCRQEDENRVVSSQSGGALVNNSARFE